MHITQLIIDGFKSYGTRTVINGWDPSFTAITGENGSGKSNILDAICFVLGISQLSNVRASSLRELVYKQGQAGITKASVTIVFDNSDRASSPIGYEECGKLSITRQVVVNGKNKYLINGHTAQLNRIQNLFQSVQLNIQNPTFLVMQGRITKVLNMKPIEILGLIEEAAGTKMFEAKKIAACNTIAKKDLKVAEINTILKEEITPQLVKLRHECTLFMKWSANMTEIQRLERRTIAFRYFQTERALCDSNSVKDDLTKSLNSLQDQKENLIQQIHGINEEIGRADRLISRESKQLIEDLQESVTTAAKKVVQHDATLSNVKKSLAEEELNQAHMSKTLKEAQSELETKTRAHADRVQARDELEKQKKSLQNRINAIEGEAIGIVMTEDGAGSLTAQLMDADKRNAECTALQKQSASKLAHLRKTRTEHADSLQRCAPAYHSLVQEREALRSRIDSQQSQLDGLEPETLSAQLRDLDAQITAKDNDVVRLRENVARLRSQTARFEFDYSSPSQRFDPASVKGRVAKRIQLRNIDSAVALEVTAGGRLYNVIVDTHITGAALLKNGRLKSRVTFIPLNKITGQDMPDNAIRRAVDLVGDDNVFPATSLICYDDEVSAAIRYVFGQTFVCRDPETAKVVTFDKHIQRRCVTFQGDLFDPKGTLSGGSRSQQQPALILLQRLYESQGQLLEAEQMADQIREARALLKQKCDGARNLMEAIEADHQRVELLTQRIEHSESHSLQVQIDALDEEIRVSERNVSSAEADARSYSEKIAALKNQIDQADSGKGKGRAHQEKEIESINAQLQSIGVKLSKLHQECLRSDLEITGATKEIDSLLETQASVNSQIEELKRNVRQYEQKLVHAKERHDSLQKELENEQQKVLESDEAARSLAKRRDILTSQLTDIDLGLKTIQHKLARFEKDQDANRLRMQQCLESNPWIENDKHLFGRPGTQYDFAAHASDQDATTLAQMRKEQDAMSKKINRKVMALMNTAEARYQALLDRRAIVENDKAKIERVIQDLDRNKNELLQSIWEKVNTDFGQIFSTLLPGAFAKLQPPLGGTVLDGLEVRVSFGGIWKESLTELSGGQRSLLALSLILALLLYKPAPMYILDEVDAALDLSHTQNIGNIIKNKFSQSQFIVVSLKEGMFNNANTILRTKFVDGVSTVQIQKSKTQPAA